MASAQHPSRSEEQDLVLGGDPTKTTTATSKEYIASQDSRRSPSFSTSLFPPSEDPVSSDYDGGLAGYWDNNPPQPDHKGLAHRWGVSEAEFNYQTNRPRFWLYYAEHVGIDGDRWSLSPWALAYYDRYPEEMDGKTLEYYLRSKGKPRVGRFVDTKDATLVMRDNDRNIKPAGTPHQVPDEPVGDPEGLTYWVTRKPKPRNSWIKTGRLLRSDAPIEPSPTDAEDDHLQSATEDRGETNPGDPGSGSEQLGSDEEDGQPQPATEDAGQTDHEDLTSEGDLPESDENLAMDTYSRELQQLRLDLLMEDRDRLWDSFSRETKDSYWTKLPLLPSGLSPPEASGTAEQVDLEDEMMKRSARYDDIRERWPKVEVEQEELE